MKHLRIPSTLKELLLLYSTVKESIHTRLAEFQNVPREEYFYELLYCLLTPQSRATHASKVVRQLQALDFAHHPFNPEPLLRNPEHYIRFHKTKAQHLLLAQQQQLSILSLIDTHYDAVTLRKFLVQTVKGFGYKEATHFLRNIGKNDSCAILDRHILRMLQHFQVITDIPFSLSPSKYLDIESKFQTFAQRIGLSVNELDLLFWYIGSGEILK